MWYRVGRHLSGAMEVINWTGMFFPEKEVIVSWPLFEDLKEHDCGYFLHDPAKYENRDRVQVVYRKPVKAFN